MVVRNSPMRRFRVQVNSLSSGKLKWTPVRIRAIQGHRAFLVGQGGMASMIRTMYTFDPDFDLAKVDDPSVHPAFSARPEDSPVWEDFPRVIYHTCDQAAFLSIIRYMAWCFFVNRAYVNHRKAYQEILKEAKENFDPTDVLISKMEMFTEDAKVNFDGIKARIEFGKLLPFSRREDLQVEKSTATREGEPASGTQLVQGYTIAKMAAMTSTDACGFQRRGRHGVGGGNLGQRLWSSWI